MEIDEKIRNRFNELIGTGEQLKHGNQNGQVRGEEHRQSCVGWLASAQNIVHLVVTKSENPYRSSVDKICNKYFGYCVQALVGDLTVILRSLLEDIDHGLLASIEDQTRAEVFDDFLDHAKHYAKKKSYKEAGVISGVIFEDTIRALYRSYDGEDKGIKLDSIIDELVKKNVLSQVKAKRAKVAANVRTKATHAQWDEFDLNDVNTAINFTEELIFKYIDK